MWPGVGDDTGDAAPRHVEAGANSDASSHVLLFMRKALLALALLLGAVAASPLASADDASTVLKGTYQWNGGSRGPLTATFAPDGENQWQVSFRFTHGGSSYTWDGTASGSLTRGALEGRVRDSRSGRVFTFEGDFDDAGRFEGRHSEVHSGGAQSTGTMRLAS